MAALQSLGELVGGQLREPQQPWIGQGGLRSRWSIGWQWVIQYGGRGKSFLSGSCKISFLSSIFVLLIFSLSLSECRALPKEEDLESTIATS